MGSALASTTTILTKQCGKQHHGPPSYPTPELHPLLPTTNELRKHHRNHQRSTIEEILNERAYAEDRQTGNPGHQKINADHRPPWIEAAGIDAGCTEKSRCESGQQESEARTRISSCRGSHVDHPGHAADGS